jgi:hypothetical protein
MPTLKWDDVKTVTPGQFYLSVQDPVEDDGFRFLWNDPASILLPTLKLSDPHSALLAKLAVPILRHVTETVSPVDAMTTWDADVWLSRPHPLVKPENITVMPKEMPKEMAGIFK